MKDSQLTDRPVRASTYSPSGDPGRKELKPWSQSQRQTQISNLAFTQSVQSPASEPEILLVWLCRNFHTLLGPVQLRHPRLFGSCQVCQIMQESKIEEIDKDADLRHPSINTEPRTLDENSIERAQLAAQKIYARNPEPNSDCFTKVDDIRSTSRNGQMDKVTHKKSCHDAYDSATRENAPAEDAADADALGSQLDELISNTENVVDTNFTQSKAPVRTGSTPAAAPSQEPST